MSRSAKRDCWILHLLLGALLGGCVPPAKDTPELGDPQSPEFAEAQQLFLNEQFPESAARFELFLQRYPHSPYAAQAAHWAGRCHLKTGQYGRARDAFTLALRRATTTADESLARMGLADAFFMETSYTEAEKHYRQVHDSSDPGDVPLDLVLYRLGQCAQRRGHTAEADQWFSQLKARFPDSPYVPRVGSPAPPKADSGGGSGSFYVQLGLFSTRSAADKHTQTLAGRGIRAQVTETASGGRTLYRVRAGSYSTFAQAEAEARRLKAMGIEAVAK